MFVCVFYTCSACFSYLFCVFFILVLRVFYTCSACSYYSFFTRYPSEIPGGRIILYVDLISYLDNFVISVHCFTIISCSTLRMMVKYAPRANTGKYSVTSLKRTSSKADISLRRKQIFVPDEFLRNPL